MLVALYIGDHAKDTLAVRLGWWLTKTVQKGPYGGVTHCEAIHTLHDDGTVTIASASLRDGGVRSKVTDLTPGNWRVVDVPMWDVAHSIDLLALTQGQPYDLRGAIATVLPGCPQQGHWFCNGWVGRPHLKASSSLGPNHFAAICLSFGRDITAEFFAERSSS